MGNGDNPAAGSPGRSGAPLPPIKFAELAKALLDDGESLVNQWLPGGTKRGHEYVCGSLSGGAGSSCSINLNTGAWADFQAGEQGGDLLSLYAAIEGLTMGKAALQVARDHGLEQVAGILHGAPPAAGQPAKPPRPAPPPKPAKAEPEGWTSVVPVPAHALAPTFRHFDRAPETEEHRAEYRVGDALYGYVVRFRTSTGGKDTLPYHYCQSAKDGGARWHWKQWDEPRPLYLPAHQLPGERTVVLVEGEKKADTLQALLEAGAPGVYCVASWPGGSKAWKKADWSWLQGCSVLLWPDCDAKREPLTPKERQATPDKLAQQLIADVKPIMPAKKQPGMSAMLGIGALLRDAHACTAQLLAIPEPGAVVDGWDCGDAITADAWDFARVLQFFGTAYALPPGGEVAPPAANKADAEKKRDRPVSTGGIDDGFQDYLDFMCEQLKCEPHALGVNRKMLIAALRRAPELKECLGFDELIGAPGTRTPWPWRKAAEPLKDQDALRLGDWLSATYKIKPASRAALEEAIETVADERRFHPIRDWLRAQEHDGKERCDKWLIHVLGMDPERLAPRRKRYLELVGRFLLMGLVARVMDPGCKFDYSPVFEGLTGVGKSTLVRELVGQDYFSDTHFDIGSGKDGMEQLEGLWAYELSEMTAFKRADNEQVKQFFSSTIDRFRGAYGKYVQKHPRQCIIMCTTNKRRYLFDLTGNRRFWPIWIEQAINIEWLKKYRGQLLAEAFKLYTRGDRYTPTREEEDAYFVPEQRMRLVETAVQSRMYELLTREGAAPGESKLLAEITQFKKHITTAQLVAALGADAAKSSNMLEGQIAGWLEAQGWIYKRASTGNRAYGYQQPKVWPPVIVDDEEDTESDYRPAQADEDKGNDDDPF